MGTILIAPLVGVAALLFAFYKASIISKAEPGNDRMKEISSYMKALWRFLQDNTNQ
jgi:K(+)-stimulated pyrophosphate-energized sodium pump